MDDILNFVLESESGSDISIDDTSDDSDENVEYISEEVVESSDQNEEHKNENQHTYLSNGSSNEENIAVSNIDVFEPEEEAVDENPELDADVEISDISDTDDGQYKAGLQSTNEQQRRIRTRGGHVRRMIRTRGGRLGVNVRNVRNRLADGHNDVETDDEDDEERARNN